MIQNVYLTESNILIQNVYLTESNILIEYTLLQEWSCENTITSLSVFQIQIPDLGYSLLYVSNIRRQLRLSTSQKFSVPRSQLDHDKHVCFSVAAAIVME